MLEVAGLIVGLIITIVALRGRRVGDHPHCRRCGFDLFGLPPNNAHCPECGANVTTPKSVRIGERRVRRRLLAFGILCTLACGVQTANTAYDLVDRINWIRYKPFGWLLNDAVDKALATDTAYVKDVNIDELTDRYASERLSRDQADRVISATLDLQADYSKPWPVEWTRLLDDMLTNRELTELQLRRYIEQGVALELNAKPNIRRGRNVTIRLNSAIGRLTSSTELAVRRQTGTVHLGGVPIIESRSSEDDGTQRHPLHYNMSIRLPNLPQVADGPTQFTTRMIYQVALTEPISTPPLQFETQLSVPVELVEHDAVVDTFVSDPAKSEAMRKAVGPARIETSPQGARIWIRTERLPVELAMTVWARQGGTEQRIGTLRTSLSKWHLEWHEVQVDRSFILRGVVDILLKPSQEAADATRWLNTYWGDAMALTGVTVNAPYTPAFNTDVFLAPQVEASVKLRNFAVDEPGRISRDAEVIFDNPPHRFVYRIVLRCGNKHVDVQSDAPYFAGPGSVSGFRFPDTSLPNASAKTFDVLLIPDERWEYHTTDPTPPWGFPLIFENLPLPRKSKDEQPAGPVHPRAILQNVDEFLDRMKAAPAHTGP